jgi:predicted ATP-dependent serine protease
VTEVASSRRFVCKNCRAVHLKWSARCPTCLETVGLVVETSAPPPAPIPEPEMPTNVVPIESARPKLVIARAPSPEPELEDPAEELIDLDPDDEVHDQDGDGPVPITEVAETMLERLSSGLQPFDYVLGGGLVPASVILLAAPRGIGKSSLALQVLKGLNLRCLYATGEETKVQLAGTARRIDALTPRLHVLAEQNLPTILAGARKVRAEAIVIDSINKMHLPEIGGRPGSPGQLKECTAELIRFAKKEPIQPAILLIGHVTSDGDIAGPQTIEHDVDVVLELTAGMRFDGNERILRCLGKNRFGPSTLIGHFELTATGLVPIDADDWNEKF